MIVTVVVVLLAGLAGLAVLRPFTAGRPGALHADADPDEDLRRALLRQLRDLDDDLASGRVGADEHRALRSPLETEAIAVLRRIDQRVGSGELAAGLREIRPAPTPSPRRRLRGWVVGLAVAAVTAGGATALLLATVDRRDPGDSITGDAAAAPGDAADPLALAQARVRRNPRDVTAHLDLAQLYVAAGQRDGAAIEYLAVTQVEPVNPAANTGLALLAFQAGQVPDAKARLDRVLRANPKYPEALYARGVVELTGLGQPAPAKRDLDAYLRVAPYGSHRSAVLTLLASITSGAPSHPTASPGPSGSPTGR